MTKPESCEIKYIGIKTPKTPEEIRLEISGLTHAISKANERIAALNQSLFIAELYISEQKSEN